MGSVLRRLTGTQLWQAGAELALSPGEQVESRITGQPYFALEPASENSVAAAVAIAVAELKAAVI